MNERKLPYKNEEESLTNHDSDFPLTRRSVLRSAGAVGFSGMFLATMSEPSEAHETPDHLMETPPMGWNSWNTFACDIDEDLIKETADAMVESGMKEAGYEYINIDDCWMASERDEDGNLQSDPETFPNGIEGVAEYVHEKGLKLGIYSSAGTETCQGLPASLGHEEQDAESFAKWGVDYLKYDNCNNQGVDPQTRYKRMWDALDATGRDIVKSQCSWGSYDEWTWAGDLGANLWRTTGDITDSWSKIMDILDQQVGLAEYAEPGHWNDPDMLEVGNAGLSARESRSHFSLWCILAAPLLTGNDLRELDEETRDILTNEEVLAIDQDPAGIQGSKRKDTGDYEVWAKPLANGDIAVCLLNRSNTSGTIAIDVDEFDLENAAAYILRDVWKMKEVATANTIRAFVPAHGVALYRIRPGTPSEAPPATTLAIENGDKIASRGDTESVKTILTNDGRIAIQNVELSFDAPEGWHANANTSPNRTVPPSKSIETTWTIDVPEDAEVGDHEFAVTATYTAGGTSTGVSSTDVLSVPPAPPVDDTYLSNHEWLEATIGWGEIGLDESVEANTLTIGGKTYEKGIGTHAESEISYYLNGNVSRFIADVGIDDEVDNDEASVRFRVVGDGETLTETNVAGNDMNPISIDVDISGIEVLTLVVTDGGNGINYDHADWAIAEVRN